MKFFIDTANLSEIREAAGWGILDGVTTNPTLAAKEKRPFEELVAEIARIVDGPISAEVVSVSAGEMAAEAKRLSAIHPNIVIKIPITVEGMKALSKIVPQGIKVNVTLCFSAVQALIAAKAGAAYISPFVGRLDDAGEEGMELIRDIRLIYDHYGFKTQIITASVRHPHHVLTAAKMGSDVATIPFAVMKQLYYHPLTDLGLKRVLEDWKKLSDDLKK